jgi:hypothetical protein
MNDCYAAAKLMRACLVVAGSRLIGEDALDFQNLRVTGQFAAT